MSLIRTIDAFGDVFDQPRVQRVDYIDQRPRGFDPHTLRQVRADLARWAAEGDAEAIEALAELARQS